MPLDNAQRQSLWRTRRQQERALVVERLRTWANAVANADLVPETLPGVAQEMVDLANQLAGKE